MVTASDATVALTGSHTTGVTTGAWDGQNATTWIKVCGSNRGLALPLQMTEAGFSSVGGAIGVNPSALDRRWVYLHLYRPMADEALFSKATNIVATAAAHNYTGIMFSSAFGLSSYHVWNEKRKDLLGRLVAFVDSFGLEKGVAMWLPGYPKESFFPIDPNLSAANPVFGTRYRVENGKCVHVPPRHYR